MLLVWSGDRVLVWRWRVRFEIQRRGRGNGIPPTLYSWAQVKRKEHLVGRQGPEHRQSPVRIGRPALERAGGHGVVRRTFVNPIGHDGGSEQEAGE